MDPTDDELPPGYDDVIAALRSPVDVDDEVRARHLSTALASGSRRSRSTQRSRRVVRVLAAAAAVVVVGAIGTWGLAQSGGGGSSTESVAVAQSSTSIASSEAGAPALGGSRTADEKSGAPVQEPAPEDAADSAAEASVPLPDLGSFADDAALRAAAAGLAAVGPSATAGSMANSTTSAVPAVQASRAPACAVPDGGSWLATANVAGVPVLVGTTSDHTVVLADPVTCARR